MRSFLFRLSFACIALGTPFLSAQAQGLSDVMLYSRMDPLGSARSMGLGGAMTALGADLGSVSSNPAGLGMYRSSDVGISIGVGAGGGNMRYGEEQNVTAAPHVMVGQVGAALTMPMNHPQFRRGTFAFSYAPLKNFHQRVEWAGDQNGESLTQQLALQADGTSFDSLWYAQPFDANLAWYTYLIDTVGGSVNQYDPAFGPSDDVRQSLRRDRSGRMGETTFAFGTTYADALHIGMAIGLSSVEMQRTDVYSEEKTSGPSSLDRFTFNDQLEVSGSGGYWSFGLILQPKSSPIRLGWSYRSGTVYTLDDFYQVDATSDFQDGNGYEWNSPNSYVQYQIRTPRQHRLGLSWTMGKRALLSLDYGYRDYRQATFESNDFLDSDVQSIQCGIDNQFDAAIQYSGGLEFRVQDTWRIRMGGGRKSPAAKPQQVAMGSTIDGTIIPESGETIHWALGGEFRDETWYAGATYRHTSTPDVRRLYASSPDLAWGRMGLGMLMFTIGARY